MKNNTLTLLLSLLLITFLACKNEPKITEKDTLSIGQLIHIDRNMKLRNAPDTTATINSDTMLTEGNFVSYLGEKTEQLYEVKWKDGTKKITGIKSRHIRIWLVGSMVVVYLFPI